MTQPMLSLQLVLQALQCECPYLRSVLLFECAGEETRAVVRVTGWAAAGLSALLASIEHHASDARESIWVVSAILCRCSHFLQPLFQSAVIFIPEQKKQDGQGI